VRRAASRHFRNKTEENLKAKIDELETNIKIEYIRDFYRGINDITKGYQPGTNIVKDEKDDLVTDCHSILTGWRNHFSQLLNAYVLYVVRQREIHTAERLVPEPSAFEVEMATEKKRKSHYVLIKFQQNRLKQDAVLRSEIHKLINFIWNKAGLPEEWKESITAPIYKKGDKTDCSNSRGMSLLSTTYKMLSNILLSMLTPYAEEITRDHQYGFRRNRSTSDHIQCSRQILQKKWEYDEAVHQLFTDYELLVWQSKSRRPFLIHKLSWEEDE
jgi:hypothetical protein